MKRCGRCFAYKRRHPYYFYRFRYTKDGFQGTCKTCCLEDYALNKEKLTNRCKEYHRNNRDKVLQRKRAYDKAHKTEHTKRHYAYVMANLEKIAAYNRAWAKEHQESVLASSRLQRAKRKQARIVDRVQLNIIYQRDRSICQLCHKHVKRPDASLDHVIPLSKGGEHSYQNVVLAHRRCNCRKGNRPVPQQQRLFG